MCFYKIVIICQEADKKEIWMQYKYCSLPPWEYLGTAGQRLYHRIGRLPVTCIFDEWPFPDQRTNFSMFGANSISEQRNFYAKRGRHFLSLDKGYKHLEH